MVNSHGVLTSISKKGRLLILVRPTNRRRITGRVSHLKELGPDAEDVNVTGRIYSQTTNGLQLDPLVNGRLYIVITTHSEFFAPCFSLADGLN